MKDNPLLKLGMLGQSVWLDYISHDLIHSGKLQQWITDYGLRGITSNPAIFEKAISASHDYDDAIGSLALRGQGAAQIYESIVVEEIQQAADEFQSTYNSTGGRDGFVSLEVSPHLAHDTLGTIEEARRLWAIVNRPNFLIKIPATQKGLPAIQQLISEGINVNVTLLFGLPRYRRVAEAYLAGLEARAVQKKPLENVASVASFFLSRMDARIDPQLKALVKAGGPNAVLAQSVLGLTAIASAKVAYQIYQEIFGSERWRKLAIHRARTQRLLWASTSTKDPDYSDVKYGDALIGPDTVNTLPLETLEAYRDHGKPDLRLTEGLAEAHQVLQNLAVLRIDLDRMAQQLEDEGVQKFQKPFDRLLARLASDPRQNNVSI